MTPHCDPQAAAIAAMAASARETFKAMKAKGMVDAASPSQKAAMGGALARANGAKGGAGQAGVLRAAIVSALRGAPMTAYELIDTLEAGRSSVRAQLSRLDELGTIEQVGMRYGCALWGLKAEEGRS